MLLGAALVLTGCPRIVLPSEKFYHYNTDDLSAEELETLTNPAVPELPFTEEEGSGTLVSRGKSPGGTTYYIDAENGNDAWPGESPIAPWKSFRGANLKTFAPGDRILLEADSVWNGTGVDLANAASLRNSNRVGMLYPKGDGAEGSPIIIDLYDVKFILPGGIRSETRSSDAESAVVYYSANRRPVINGGGTPGTGTDPYGISGAVTLMNQQYWEIYNIECTNTFADIAAEPNHWYDYVVRKPLCGIAVLGTVKANGETSTPRYKHIVIKNCYVHDVQSEHTNNGGSINYTSNYFGSFAGKYRYKVVGGIIVEGVPRTPDGKSADGRYFGYDGCVIENNIVRRVGLEGLRTKSQDNDSTTANPFVNVSIRGNYLEDIAGDGIVLSDVQNNGVVESNVLVRCAAAPNLGSANYAGVWAWYVRENCVFQYNECYGTLYGYQDGEAWDVDMGCDKVLYQYNYSHHNAGGCILFMSSGTNSVFRYNISANDAGGTRYLAAVIPGTDTSTPSYTNFQNGQTLFHYGTDANSGTALPLIYNNTFYVGDGLSCGVFGSNTSSGPTKYVRFYNNVLLKKGSGTVWLVFGHSGAGAAGKLGSDTGFANNIVYGYASDRNTGDYTKFNNGSGSTIQTLVSTNSNKWQDPKLAIQESTGEAALKSQAADAFTAFNDAAALETFVSKAVLRGRAKLLAPLSGSPCLSGGTAVPAGASSKDGAWNAAALSEDFFGAALNFSSPPIGAASAAAP
jgi:hypothetical protein